MKPYSTDLREAALRAHDTGVPLAEVARRFGVSRRTLTRWDRQRTQTGTLAPRRRSGRPPKLDASALAWLRQRVLTHPDAILADHCGALRTERDITVDRSTLSRALNKLAITHKKRV